MQRMLALVCSALLSVAIWLALDSAPVAVQAAAGPFTCQPVFYEVDSGQLVEVNPTGGAAVTIGPAQPTYNAMGYDTANNYLYAISTAAANLGHLLQIANDGSITDLTAILGAKVGPEEINAAFRSASESERLREWRTCGFCPLQHLVRDRPNGDTTDRHQGEHQRRSQW